MASSDAAILRQNEILEDLRRHIGSPLREFRKKADAAHKQVRELHPKPTKQRREVKRETLLVYGEWFVLHHVNGVTVDAIADREPDTDPSTIRKGIAHINALR